MKTPDPNRPPRAGKKVLLALNKRGEPKKRQRSKNPEMGKLKHLWTETFTEADREHWRQKFATGDNQAAKRQELRAQFGIDLDDDRLLTYFRSWDQEQVKRQQSAERLHARENQIQKEHPDWTFDQVRDAVLQHAYYEVLNGGDYKLGVQIVRTHTYVQKYLLDRDKFEFDATERCHRLLPTLRPIQQDSNLSEADKLRLLRLKIFGRIAEEQPQPTCLPPATN